MELKLLSKNQKKLSKCKHYKKSLQLLSILLVSIYVLTLTGCKTIDDFQPVDNTVPITPTPGENITITPNVGMELDLNKTNIFLFSSTDDCAFMVDKDNVSYIIDCGQENYLEIIDKIKKIGYEKVDYYIATRQDAGVIAYADKLILKFKPEIIYDTGIPSQFEKYKSFNFSKVEIVEKDTPIGSLNLVPTYKEGFFSEIEMNQLIPYNNEFIMLGDCHTECEQRLVQNNIDIVSLSNKGNCPTNSLMFLIQLNPQIVIYNAAVCDELRDDLVAMDVPLYNLEAGDIQITIGEEIEIKQS